MAEGRAERPERADAARNRRLILAATEELLRHDDPEQVTIERVAQAAGVGKATVFHRFGSRTGLMRALMEQRAAALQDAVASGPPPLGPGAPPADRLAAFLDAVLDLAAQNVGLMTAHEHAVATRRDTSGEREANPVYLTWHSHIAALIGEARPDREAPLLAHILLGALHSEPLMRMVRAGESARIAACLRDLVPDVLEQDSGR
jgi:AcrR family transcriptional regulator